MSEYKKALEINEQKINIKKNEQKLKFQHVSFKMFYAMFQHKTDKNEC